MTPTRDPGIRPLPEGFRCQQQDSCSLSESALLTKEERESPVTCDLCKRVLCDYCAAGVKIPVSAYLLAGLPVDKEEGYYDGFVCSEDFNEDWV